MMEWLRWYHGACSDPKWPLIARKAGVNVGEVVSVWVALLEHASQDEERGSVTDFDGETFDALYGYDDGTCGKIVNVMADKGLIKDGCISAWGRRQAQDESASERKRLQRERAAMEKERAALEAARHALSQTVTGEDVTTGAGGMTDCDVTAVSQPVTECHAVSQPVTECHAVSQPVTECHAVSQPCHGMSQAVTECHLEQSREDKIKIKIKNKINKTQSKHENEDPAREPEPAQVGLGESEIALPDPSVEFQELRDWYSAHARPEGGMAGFIEFKQAKAARTWPGQNRIYDDLTERCASDKWRRGFAPSLGNYLRTQGWTAPPEREADAARASPDMPRATTQKQKQEQEREAMALMVLERRRNKNAQSRNDAGGHIDAAFAVLPAGGV